MNDPQWPMIPPPTTFPQLLTYLSEIPEELLIYAIDEETKKRLAELSGQALRSTITDYVSHQAAGELLVEGKKFVQDVEKLFDMPVSLFHRLHKTMTSQRKEAVAELKNALKALEMLFNAFTEDDRIRVEKEEQAIEKKTGQHVTLTREASRVPGLSIQEKFTARVVNLEELLRAALDGKVPVRLKELVSINTKQLDKIGASMKGEMKIPGVVFERNTATRRVRAS